MPKWVKFTADHDYRPSFDQVHAYREGQVLWVKNDIADAAIKAGNAVETDKPEGGIEDGDAETADDRRDAGVARRDGADAHRGDVRVQLNDAGAGERHP